MRLHTRTLTLLVALTSAACARRASSPPTPSIGIVAPGSALLDAAHLGAYRDSVHMMTRPAGADTTAHDLGVQTVIEQPVEWRGAPALLLVKHSEGRGVVFFDSTMMHRESMQPVWEHMHANRIMKNIEYSPNQLHENSYMGDSLVRTLDLPLPHGAFGFNQLDLVLRSLRFQPGRRVTVPLFSEGDDSVEVDTISVVGREPGLPARWTLRFADPAIVATYTIDDQTRHVLTYDVVSRRSGARSWTRR